MPQYAQPRTRSPARAIIRALRAIGGLALLALVLRWVFLRLRRVVLRPTAYTTPPIEPDAISPRQRRIVLSDLHLGGGDHLDDFDDDAALIAFLDHYVSRDRKSVV